MKLIIELLEVPANSKIYCGIARACMHSVSPLSPHIALKAIAGGDQGGDDLSQTWGRVVSGQWK